MKNEISSFQDRIDRLCKVLGKKQDVESKSGISHAVLYRLLNGEQEIRPDHLAKVEALECRLGIIESPTASLLRRLLTDRYALLYNMAGNDAEKFKKLTGIPFESARCYAGDPLPDPTEIRRIASIAAVDTGEIVGKAEEAIAALESKLAVLKELVFHVRQRDQLGMLKTDPLLATIETYENELKSQ
jgi:transcriptional regulator with XRE-family HTH domain